MAGKIETGVDKLVEIINTRKRISVEDAAKELGVSKNVVVEWADFLEEEGIISIEYKLSKTFLVERKLTKTEVEKKTKDFDNEKDAFVRKVETSMISLERDTAWLTELKKHFKTLKNELGSEFDNVKNELKELEKYDDLKNSIDRQIAAQQHEFKQKIEELNRMLVREQKRYEVIIDDIKAKKTDIEKEKVEISTIEQKEIMLKNKLDEFSNVVDELKKKVNADNEAIEVSGSHIKKLEKLADEVKKNIEDKKNRIAALLDESKKNEEEIVSLQNRLLKKASEREKGIASEFSKGKDISQKFKNFFDKKIEIEGIINRIDSERGALKMELDELIKKVLGFNLLLKSTDAKSYIAELEKKFEEMEKKRSILRKEVINLRSLIKG